MDALYEGPQSLSPAPHVPLDKIEWRIDGKIDGGGGVRVVCYLRAATVAGLLDEWVGPLNWRDEYQPTSNGSLMCLLSVRVPGTDEWVTKRDVGTESNMEAAKGIMSDSFKRVAMTRWGIGRNIYDIPTIRLPQGQFHVSGSGDKRRPYLNDASATYIRQWLSRNGHEDAAQATKVYGESDNGGSSQQPSRSDEAAQQQAGTAPSREALIAAFREAVAAAQAAGHKFPEQGEYSIAAARAVFDQGPEQAQRVVAKLRATATKARERQQANGQDGGATMARPSGNTLADWQTYATKGCGLSDDDIKGKNVGQLKVLTASLDGTAEQGDGEPGRDRELAESLA